MLQKKALQFKGAQIWLVCNQIETIFLSLN